MVLVSKAPPRVAAPQQDEPGVREASANVEPNVRRFKIAPQSRSEFPEWLKDALRWISPPRRDKKGPGVPFGPRG